MGTAGRIAGGLVVAVAAIALVSRPLMMNPAFAGLLEGELFSRQTLLALPLVLVTVLLVVGRLRSFGPERGTSDPTSRSNRETVDANPLVDRDGTRSDGSPPSDQDEAADGPVEIEDDPPDAGLDDHLDHLRAEFEGDGDVLEDLDTLESVAAEADDGSLPKRCPGDYCEGRWTERTILGGEAGQYQMLDDGRVLCEECEGIFDVA